MRIIVDAMGGDNAPEQIIRGCVDACDIKKNLYITLVGDSSTIETELHKYEYPAERFTIRHTTEVITTNEAPVNAVKKKKDSSLVVGLEMLSVGEGDAFVSAGSTGAVLTGALLRVGRIRGVQRPALSPLLPNKGKGVLLIDCGANMDCKPIYLEQFAIMGSIYLNKVFGFENPRVGLVNVGVEEEKGNELVKAVHGMLKNNKNINFAGNVEGRDLFDGNFDIAVCDGFVGNLILKTAEGMGLFIFDGLKEAFMLNLKSKLAALVLKPSLRVFKKKLDHTEHGGAPLLGINGVVIKAHGSSDAKSFKNALFQAVNMIEKDIINLIKTSIENMDIQDI